MVQQCCLDCMGIDTEAVSRETCYALYEQLTGCYDQGAVNHILRDGWQPGGGGDHCGAAAS
jgi:hypothetical protein